MELFKLFGSIAINDEGASKSLDNIDGKAKKTEGGFKKASKNIAKGGSIIAGGLATAGAGMFALATKTAGTADEFDKTSQKMGISTDALQELRYAHGQVGVEQATMDKALQRTNQRMGEAQAGNEKYSDALDAMGISMKDSNGNMKDADQVYLEAIDSLGSMESSAEASALASEFFGKKTAQEMMPAIEAGGDTIRALGDDAQELGMVLSGDAIDTSVEFADTMDTMKGVFQGLVNEIGVAVMPMFTSFMNLIKDNMPQIKEVTKTVFEKMRDVISTTAEKVGKLVEWFIKYQDVIIPLVATIAGIVASVKAFRLAIVAITAVKTAWATVTGIAAAASLTLGGAIAFLTSPITLVVAAIAGLIAIGVLLYKNWDTVKEYASIVWEGIKTIFVTVLNFLKEFITGIWNGIKKATELVWNGIKAYFTMMFEIYKTIFTTIFDTIKKVVTVVWDTIKNVTEKVWNGIKEFFTTIFDVYKTIITKAFNAYKKIITTVFDAIKNVIETVWGAIKGFFTTTFNFLKNAFTKAFDAYKNIVTTIFDAITNVTETVWNGIKKFFTTIFDFLKNAFTKAFDAFKKTVKTVFDAIANVTETVWNTIKNFFTTTFEFLKNAFSKAFEAIKKTVETVFSAIKNVTETVWESIKSFFTATFKFLKNAFSKAFEAIKKTIETVFNAIKNVTETIWNAIKKFFSTVFNSIKSIISKVVNTIKNVISKTWKKIKSITSNIFGGIKNVISNVWGGIKSSVGSAVDWIKNKVEAVFKKVASTSETIFNGLKRTLTGVWDGIWGGIKGTLNSIIGGINGMIRGMNKLSFSAPDWVPGIGGRSWGMNIPSIPRLATGGITTGSTLANIGEAGREAVLPLEGKYLKPWASEMSNQLLKHAGGFNNNSGGSTTLIIEMDSKKVAEKVIPHTADVVRMKTGLK